MKKAVRQSNIELLRIISILMVIAGHYYIHADWGGNLTTGNEIFLKIWGGGAKLAVNVFVLITGYFGANIQDSRRIIPLICDRYFYSWLTTAVLLSTGLCSLSGKLLAQTVAPLLFCRHNYIVTFIMLYLFIPYLNRILRLMEQKDLKKVLFLSIILFSLLPSVCPLLSNNTYAYILWMGMLYCIGWYIRLYDWKPPFSWKILLAGSLLSVPVVTLVIEPAIQPYYLHYFQNSEYPFYTNVQYSVILLIPAVSLLGVFSEWKTVELPLINWFSASTFAVYILHDDPYVRNVIWSRIFQNARYAASPYLWLHAVATMFAIYLTCIAIDKIYRLTVRKLVIYIYIYIYITDS